MARVVFHTFGSLGDLHPYLAVAIGLRERGHEVAIATSAVYREKVEAEGVEFSAVRPDVGELLGDKDFLEKLWHPRLGSEYLIRRYLLPQLEQSYEDLLVACRGADLMLTHMAGYAGPIAADIMHVPWVSVALQPMVFFSAYDPPVISGAVWLRHLYSMGTVPFRILMRMAGRRLRVWAEPIQRLRERVGLPRLGVNPLLEGQFSRMATLALFSRHFATAQRDWPPNARVTGFVFYDRQRAMPRSADADAADEGLARFLEQGAAPVLFTLGSSAVMQPGTFYRESVAAVQMTGMRAVLLVGLLDQHQLLRQQLPRPLPESIYVANYVRYSQIMPRSAAIVHQGGIGTTAQALRSGRPMLVVPWAHDQPDNAGRLRKLGVGRTIPRSRYTAARVARELAGLLNDKGYERRAKEIGAKIASEDGETAACDAVEGILRGLGNGAI